MELEAFETTVHRYEEFGSPTITPGEQVFLYRRMQDAHDPSLIAVINERQQVLGYLDYEVARSIVLPAIKEGTRFQCTVLSEPKGGTFQIQITPVSQSTVNEILSRRSSLRRQASGLPPLAGVFDEDEELFDIGEDEEDEELDELLGGLDAIDEEPLDGGDEDE
ncbi:MAG: hypothetical protein KatS3mg115_1691 [Candidatus Poribacteria bacterium]|nr:MAG: hypothetical protein KatS3mg115_1691 [Candidatus Poribacteria bacterium]